MRYSASELDELLPPEPKANSRGAPFTMPDGPLAKGEGRNTALYKLVRALRAKNVSAASIMVTVEAENARFRPPLPPDELHTLLQHALTQADRPDFAARVELGWPQLAPEALHGLAGEIVKTIAPYTEADPVATLVHVLTAVGNLIGSGPHARVQHDRHPARLNVALVGRTAKARKGLAWSTPRHMLAQVDEPWGRLRVKSGLSSGEGLIYKVRDAREEQQPTKEKGHVVDYQRVVVDEGEQDKRLLVIEPELAVVLKNMARETNTLSGVLRQAWDFGDLSTLTKNSPVQATGAHISIVGHITQDELLRYLTETERANGFANRFLWLLVRRSNVLPDGAVVPEDKLAPLVAKLQLVVDAAKNIGEIQRDEAARAIWAEVYPRLSAGESGMVGAIIARAEAQVLRLSVLYAVLDRANVVRAEHLKAALALWDYAEASARLIFGGRLGYPMADRILAALRANKSGLTETEIHNLFGRHKSAGEIVATLDFLQRRGLAVSSSSETAGRPKTIWNANYAKEAN